MDLYSIISQDSATIGITFSITSGLWVFITFFLKQRHERKMEELRSQTARQSEVDSKIFLMKAERYDHYVEMFDSIGNKTKNNIAPKAQEIVTTYLKRIFESESYVDPTILEKYISDMVALFNESIKDFSMIKNETSRIKLIASDQLCNAIDELQQCLDLSMNASEEFFKGLATLMMNNDQKGIQIHTDQISKLILETDSKRAEVINIMRNDLRNVR